MAKVAVGFLLVSVFGVVVSAPAGTYDQRQQGELNIHAQFDNIAIVVIPSSSLNIMSLFRKNFGEKTSNTDKGGFIQLFQKPHKIDIDRYETSDVSQPYDNSIKTEMVVPVITSQQVDVNKEGQNEEEVVATVEEMKPEIVDKPTDSPKLEATEVSPNNKHSTVSETIQESVLKISIPEELKDAVKTAEKDVNPQSSVKSSEQDSAKAAEMPVAQEEEPHSAGETPQKELPDSAKPIVPSPQEEISTDEQKLVTASSESSESDGPTINDFIRPVAEKEKPPTANIPQKTEEIPTSPLKKSSEPARLLEGVRKEKVIRYKPETKWAPELVDLLGPPRQKPKDVEVRRFASLCSPGVWDTDLKTCIMPGETRSRSELARFLEAMRFGIAVPAQ